MRRRGRGSARRPPSCWERNNRKEAPRDRAEAAGNAIFPRPTALPPRGLWKRVSLGLQGAKSLVIRGVPRFWGRGPPPVKGVREISQGPCGARFPPVTWERHYFFRLLGREDLPWFWEAESSLVIDGWGGSPEYFGDTGSLLVIGVSALCKRARSLGRWGRSPQDIGVHDISGYWWESPWVFCWRTQCLRYGYLRLAAVQPFWVLNVSWVCQLVSAGGEGVFANLTVLSPKALKWIRGRLLHSDKLHHGGSVQIFHVALIADCILSLASKWLVFGFYSISSSRIVEKWVQILWKENVETSKM